MKLLSSDERKSTRSAHSVGVPARSIGMLARSDCANAGEALENSAVPSIWPGWIEFTRMPQGANSTEAVFDNLGEPRSAPSEPEGVAGYYRSCGGLTHLTVGGAGHLVPHDAPSKALDMIERFVAGAFEERCQPASTA